MRLLDRILSYGFQIFKGVSTSKAEMLEDLGGSQLVVIDNVADYYYSQRLGDFFSTADFPNVMLPFELCFFEFRLPPLSRAPVGSEEVGVFMAMREPDEFLRNTYPAVLGQGGVKFYLECRFFVRQAGYKQALFVAQYLLPVDKDGQAVSPNDRMQGVTNIFIPGLGKDDNEANLRFIHQSVIFPTFLALSFMHCRNVRMRQEVPPPKLSKSHQKKQGRPLLRYHVLQIDHMKSVLEREGHASMEGLKKALHICRGHFATYGSGGKGLLFGKLSGRYWIPMHVRGTLEEGVVVKGYEVK
ncbi:MAG: hypothetical protein Q8O75_00775 [bacterium]|nr:hypothetical protein [bacterium]